MSRTPRLSSVFVELVDALKQDFDLFEFYDHVCRQAVELFEVGGSGLLFPEGPGRLRAVAASGRDAWTLGHLQARQREGPCVEGLTRGEIVLIRDLTMTARRWPKFVEAATRHGYTSTAAIPLQRDSQVLGILALYDRQDGGLRTDTVAVAQAMADLCALTIKRDSVLRSHEVLARQLQSAQRSRVIIEQAKGVLAERLDVPADEAFERLRGHARSSNRKMAEIASALLRQHVSS
jgi:GAF domain-containing protein